MVCTVMMLSDTSFFIELDWLVNLKLGSQPYIIMLRRLSTTTASAAESLRHRALPSITDWISPQPSHLLSLCLAPYLRTSPSNATNRSSPRRSGELPPGHHLVYFPPQLPEELLLPDGSDSEQHPGPPWTRRLWAGGSVVFDDHEPLQLHDEAVLRERVESVQAKPESGGGGGGGDRLFVCFRREIFRVSAAEGKPAAKPAITERRCLAFLPPLPPHHQQQQQQQQRLLRPKAEAHFRETFTPSQHLLFRFSALTFNAHRIHYDWRYATGPHEGHRDILCHGPLAVVLLLGLLQKQLGPVGGQGRARVTAFEYRCLVPMVVGEPYSVAGRWRDTGAGGGGGTSKVELWAETPQGGIGVRGTADIECCDASVV